MDVCGHGGPLQLLPARRDAAVKDVVADGVVEKDRILRNHADVRPEGRLAHLGVGGGGLKRQNYKHTVSCCFSHFHHRVVNSMFLFLFSVGLFGAELLRPHPEPVSPAPPHTHMTDIYIHKCCIA